MLRTRGVQLPFRSWSKLGLSSTRSPTRARPRYTSLPERVSPRSSSCCWPWEPTDTFPTARGRRLLKASEPSGGLSWQIRKRHSGFWISMACQAMFHGSQRMTQRPRRRRRYKQYRNHPVPRPLRPSGSAQPRLLFIPKRSLIRREARHFPWYHTRHRDWMGQVHTARRLLTRRLLLFLPRNLTRKRSLSKRRRRQPCRHYHSQLCKLHLRLPQSHNLRKCPRRRQRLLLPPFRRSHHHHSSRLLS